MHTTPTPVEINLHQQSRILSISFDDGAKYDLPCEYLRVFSPSAEVKAARNRGEIITGKMDVNINRISPVGGYAVQIEFDDGHESGVYSFPTLYELGQEHAANWTQYLKQLEESGISRDGSRPQAGPYSLKILYFVTLVDKLGLQEETIEVPESVVTAGDLLDLLHERGNEWTTAMIADSLQITVNRQFETVSARLKANDEIGLVPKTT